MRESKLFFTLPNRPAVFLLGNSAELSGKEKNGLGFPGTG